TPLGPAHEPGLADAEGREVVVVEVALGRLEPERVQAHLLTRGAERDHAEGLSLTAREQGGPVRTRGHAHLDRDWTDLLGRAAVRALLVHGDALADDRLLELVEGELGPGSVLGVGLGLGVTRVLDE